MNPTSQASADGREESPLIPVRMVNEYVYCPRLAYLMWVQQEWADSGETVDGRFRHRNVDGPPREKKDEDENLIHARSITLSSETLGIIAKLDLVEGDGENQATPVEYKRGKRPHLAKGAYEPEQVQLCAQGLLLEEHGYRAERGEIWFHGSRERVTIAFDEALRTLTREAIKGLRNTAESGVIPAPLEDSPKCHGCSLVAICLPDELRWFHDDEDPPRPLAVDRDTALPLYVQAWHAKVGKSGNRIQVEVDDAPAHSQPFGDTSQLVLMGNVYLTTPCLNELMRRQIPVSWHSHGGWFYGHTLGVGHKNVELRTAQYRASFEAERCLQVARELVRGKILNSRTLLRRNHRGDAPPAEAIKTLKFMADQATRANNLPALLGVEGNAAAAYFGAFNGMLRQGEDDAIPFTFEHRNRRPPKDPVNALLSFAYAMLTRTLTQVLSAVGFDPYRGFYHQPRYGRPALALDLMEPFRPLIADSAVLTAINNGEIKPKDFIHAAGAVALKDKARKQFIQIFERRLSQEISHPQFGYNLSYRRLLEVQARLFGRYLSGEIRRFPNLITR